MRARVVAPLLAAVLGIAGGVTTALATGGSSPAAADPLHLGIPLVDLDCSHEAITVLAYGADAAALGTAVANPGGDRAHYLRSSESCPTVYGSEQDPHPAYVVYAGPYPTPTEPCATRMSGDARRGSVTVLRSGNQDFVKCACVLGDDAGPTLRVGMREDARVVAWVRLLQVMLNDDDPQAFPRAAITGEYDQRTADRVATYQSTAPGKLTDPGVVDATTWGILTDRMCKKNYSW